MSELLKVENLTKIFSKKGKEVRAVDDVSFSLNEKETIGLVGESGCGKSTTGRLVLNLIKPTSGTVSFMDKNIYTLNKKELLDFRRNAQIIFQDCFASLSPRFRVGDLIEETLAIHHIGKNRKERMEMAAKVFEDVTLSPELLNRYPHEFSGGQRQRIGIARALCLNPKMIVCDEPVSALDVSIQAQIINMMQDIQQKYGLSYIFISHDLSVVKHISDRVIVMYLGKIVEYGDKKSFFENPRHPYTQALLSAIPVADISEKKEKIILKNEANFEEYKPGCRFADRCWKACEICRREQPQFTEVSPGHCVACHRLD
nr:ABC transporter ATP-binding protein [uncultured Blautia sp.]